MTSPLQARQACVEVVKQALYLHVTDDGFGDPPLYELMAPHQAYWQGLAEAAVAVLLGTPDTPCPECEAGLLFEGTGWVGLPFQCERCDGSGVVPGQPGLRTPCQRCNGQHLMRAMNTPVTDGTGRVVASAEQYEECPDCTDGLGLAAIDVARGGELLTERLLDEPCPFDTVLVRFPYRRVTGEQT